MMQSLIGRSVQNASEHHSVINVKVGVQNSLLQAQLFCQDQMANSDDQLKQYGEIMPQFKAYNKAINAVQQEQDKLSAKMRKLTAELQLCRSVKR
jgi:septal ring factor EnvC (AmiA/AmiB activator)